MSVDSQATKPELLPFSALLREEDPPLRVNVTDPNAQKEDPRVTQWKREVETRKVKVVCARNRALVQTVLEGLPKEVDLRTAVRNLLLHACYQKNYYYLAKWLGWKPLPERWSDAAKTIPLMTEVLVGLREDELWKVIAVMPLAYEIDMMHAPLELPTMSAIARAAGIDVDALTDEIEKQYPVPEKPLKAKALAEILREEEAAV